MFPVQRRGLAEIVVEKIFHSPQFQRFQMRLLREGEEKVRALATFSTDKENCSEKRYETEPAPLPADESWSWGNEKEHSVYLVSHGTTPEGYGTNTGRRENRAAG